MVYLIAMKKLLNRLVFQLATIIFSIFDSFLWVLIKILPARNILKMISYRKWNFLKLKFSKFNFNRIKFNLIKITNERNKKVKFFSSCLSRSLTAKIFLTFINSETQLKLGISLNENGKKVPHAWLVDSSTGLSITPGLDNRKSIYLSTY